MLALPPSGLAIRQAQKLPNEGNTKLPNISESFGSGGALDIHMDGRLPSICDLLRDVLPPPTKSQYHPTFSPSPLLAPIGCFPSPFGNPHPTWPALRPRSQSVSGQYPAYLSPPQPLVPRRASAGCIGSTTRSYTVPGHTSSHHHHLVQDHHHNQQQQQHRANPDREHSRQRRGSKQALRRRSGAPPSPSYSSSASSSSDSEPATPRSTTTTNDNNNNNTEQGSLPNKKEKRNNAPYTFEQEAFTIYHRIDLDLPWEQVRAAYMARWPGLKRSVSGLECAYYRTNKYLPAVTPGDGLLVLVDVEEEEEERGQSTDAGLNGGGYHPTSSMPDVSGENPCRGHGWGWQQQQQQQQQFGYEEGGSVAEDSEGGGEKGEKHVWYKYYKGVAYRTRQVPCRRGRYSLMERFPEELVDEKNDWVREEHRVMARDIGEYTFRTLRTP